MRTRTGYCLLSAKIVLRESVEEDQGFFWEFGADALYGKGHSSYQSILGCVFEQNTPRVNSRIVT